MIASAVVTALALAPLPARAGPGADSVVLVVVDGLRADRVFARRGGRPLMPNLARLARESVVFEQAVAQAPWTLPSMMSVITSLYPNRHGLVNRVAIDAGGAGGPATLAPSLVTLAQALKEAGLATAAFTGGAGMAADFGFSRGFDVYGDSTPFAGFGVTVPQAIDWLEGRKEPFFLLVHGYDVHGLGPSPAAARTRERFLETRRRSIEDGPRPASAGERRFWERIYDERAAHADRGLGALLAALAAEPGLLDRTAVVVLSDHGEDLLEHGRLDHGMTLSEAALRVPLLWRLPGVAPASVRGQARLIDVAPTILDVLGVRHAGFAGQSQGASLIAALRSGPMPALDALAETDFLRRVSKRALRSPDGRKLVFDLDTLLTESFDVSRDPVETRPVTAPASDAVPGMARLRELMGVPSAPDPR